MPPPSLASVAAARPGAAAPPAPAAAKGARRLPFPIGAALFRAVNVKGSLMLLALVAVGAWYLQHREESLLRTTQSVQVDRVVDGDTFIGTIAPSAKAVLLGQQVRFRLRMVDAPELSQPHGQQATAALKALLFSVRNDREVVCRIWEKDTWGRLIVDVFTRDNIQNNVTYVQGQLVAGGHAWVFGGFSHDRSLAALEEAAKAAKLGLWAAEHPVQPWMHRRMERGEFDGPDGKKSPGAHSSMRQQQRHQQQQHDRSSYADGQHDSRAERERLKRGSRKERPF